MIFETGKGVSLRPRRRSQVRGNNGPDDCWATYARRQGAAFEHVAHPCLYAEQDMDHHNVFQRGALSALRARDDGRRGKQCVPHVRFGACRGPRRFCRAAPPGDEGGRTPGVRLRGRRAVRSGHCAARSISDKRTAHCPGSPVGQRRAHGRRVGARVSLDRATLRRHRRALVHDGHPVGNGGVCRAHARHHEPAA